MKWAVVLKGLCLQGPDGQGVGLQGPRGLRVGPRERVPGGQGVGLQGPRGSSGRPIGSQRTKG